MNESEKMKYSKYSVLDRQMKHERNSFNKREQDPNETIDTYDETPASLTKTCKYVSLKEELIGDRIIIGIRDNNTREKLLQERNLNIQKCIDICRANKKTESQLKVLEEVHYMNSPKKS